MSPRILDQSSKLSFALSALGIVAFASLIILLVATLVAMPFAGSDDLAGWVQATGAVIAIVTGFAGVLYQVDQQAKEQAEAKAATGRAAHTLAGEAFDLVTDRLSSARQPGKSSSLYALRGLRTTEMVAAMREFDAGSLPTALIAPFAKLRSCVFAINSRISEIYETENLLEAPAREAAKMNREADLQSAVQVHGIATDTFTELDKLAVTHCQATTRPQNRLAT